MTWRDNMQKGSFRGVAFGVKSQDTEGGRRVAKHEYPGRDTPWAEDLGRKSRTHSLEMLLVGANYMTRRDAMLTALEKAGAAELVHPWLGRLQVQVETYRLRESTSAGGMATFTISFIEAGKRLFPNSAVSTASEVDKNATAAIAVVNQGFVDVFSVDKQPGWVADAAIANIDAATSAINKVTESMPGIPSALTDFQNSLGALQSATNNLVRDPLALASDISSSVNTIASVFAGPLDALRAYNSLSLFGTSLPATNTNTPARKVELENQQATTDFIKQTATIEAARTSSVVVPDSSAAATVIRDDLAERLDILADTASDDMYVVLMDLRAAVVKDLTSRAAQLPQISQFTPFDTLPALVVAQRIHGDAKRESEIVRRNRIHHPGFVSGGTPLEVLNA